MTVALIVAAGSGERLGAGRPKGLVELGGKPMVQWSVEALRSAAAIGRIVVALPGGAELPAACAGAGEDETVLVHDAARPLITVGLAESVMAGLLANPGADAAIAAAPVSDTIKRVDERMAVTQTLVRSELAIAVRVTASVSLEAGARAAWQQQGPTTATPVGGFFAVNLVAPPTWVMLEPFPHARPPVRSAP